MMKLFDLKTFQGSVTDDELAEITRKRSKSEMTVADIINLTK